MGRIAARFGVEGVTRQFACGSLVSILIQGVGTGLIFFSKILMVRILGAGGYSLFATVMAGLQVLAMVALLGSNPLLRAMKGCTKPGIGGEWRTPGT